MKRTVAFLAITVLMVSAMSMTVFARGGRGYSGGMHYQPLYALCTEEGCGLLGLHQHDGDWYCSQTVRQFSYVSYEICTIEGCAEFGLHEHDGEYYYCAYRGTGRGGGCCWR